MEKIVHKEYGGERPLFASHDLYLEDVTIHAGESALKECKNIEAVGCRFEGKYPFWHVDGFVVRKSIFTEGARAALWYSRRLEMENTLVEAPKMFRDMEDIFLQRVRLTNAQETLWHCRNVELHDVEVSNADYIFMHSHNIRIENYRQQGNYSFQYCSNVTIHNAIIDSKDAFWNTEDITVYDSILNGEYLGWHSRNLRLVNCKISGTQPLCYAQNLILENCTMSDDCDLAFEYSSVHAHICGHVTSIKNPQTGKIIVDNCDNIILDDHIKFPADCLIIVNSTGKTCDTISMK